MVGIRAAVGLCLLGVASGHSRLSCPPARNMDGFDSTSIKSGPCGGDPYSMGVITTLRPGPNTVTIQESITHRGAPWRIDLLNKNDEIVCTLLDHVPHNDEARPNMFDETTWTEYYITINIPDVKCDRCSIQIANPMTDKLGYRKMKTCTDPNGTCFSVYHSCANVKITGTGELDSDVCKPHEGWPWAHMTPNEYTPTESATWKNGLLMDAPVAFRTASGVCGGVEAAASGANAAALPAQTRVSAAPTAAPPTPAQASARPATSKSKGKKKKKDMTPAERAERKKRKAERKKRKAERKKRKAERKRERLQAAQEAAQVRPSPATSEFGPIG